jgi:lipoprotein-releasing system permease protein
MIIRIAVIAVAVSLAVMLVSIAVVKGYKHEIKSKITGFSTHIQLSRLDLNNSFETSAIERDTFIERLIMECETVKGLQPFVIKAGIIKTKEDFKGIVLKGTDSLYDWGFIQQHLLEGKLPKYHSDSVSTNIIISKTIADLLKIKMGDRITIYFVQEPPRARRFTISGIFETGFGELDETYAYVDMRALQ